MKRSMSDENQPRAARAQAVFWEERWRSGLIPWDHGRAAPPFLEFLERQTAPSGSLLVPGCGSGHDVRLFAEHGARVTGMDISTTALREARRLNPHERAWYLAGDILRPPESLRGTFDWIVEHTCLCAMAPSHWEAYARSIPALLKPEGHFLAIFYRRPHDPGGPPFGISAGEIDRLFTPHFDLLESRLPARSYASRTGREEIRWYRRKGS